MLRPLIAERVASLVDVSDFVLPEHQAAYAALLAVITEHGTVDMPALCEALRRAGAEIGDDVVRLAAIVDAPDVSSWCVERHAASVADYARRRSVWAAGLALADDAQDQTRPVEHSIALAIAALRGAR